MSGIMGRFGRAGCILATVCLLAIACNADDATPQPVDRLIHQLHDGFEHFEQVLNLDVDQKAKADALEKKFVAEAQANAAKADDEAYAQQLFQDVASEFRSILNADRKKQFDQFIAESQTRLRQMRDGMLLKQVGLANLQYTNSNGGKYSPDLGSMAADAGVKPEIFLDSMSKTKAPVDWAGMDLAAKAEWINDHADLIYLPTGTSVSAASPFIVMAYYKTEVCPAENSFLMADGRVLARNAEQAKKAIEELKAGQNPPPSLESH